MDKTLGESLLQFAEEMEVSDAKSRYFYYLSNNCILDISNAAKDTQMNHFPISVQEAIKTKFAIPAVESDSRNIDCLIKHFKKINAVTSINKAIGVIEKYPAKNMQEKNIKRILRLYVHLSMHAERPWIFNKGARSNYSEEDYKLKFWAYIIETFFAHKGDTMTKPCKSKSLKFKLDLHIVVLNDEEVVVDGMTAEVAKTATKHKLYSDKLKSILANVSSLVESETTASYNHPLIQALLSYDKAARCSNIIPDNSIDVNQFSSNTNILTEHVMGK
ncbi:hypothetical protein G6F46_001172 [Rhizopus delemar]|uniref:Uncharacterized protein n=2 Tax=Rhizopus TaxID=4842 RepID=A0A9P6Z9I9_9FUNG|nr:hypothetical protein G6F55_005368 [Rhizopus delemar]KAG1545442.1 hypothetical protein G6F51_005461 [Rhizopus arrhizus]KAG1499153.1 hypothetical protein G6F54_004597 [Rhizopus delemar]KAG1512257.1 hypothetical protein G6F53_005319 [Rhizopus delemar]KAG1526170.1 hypothetical protein G6F52_002674 [Rhizopus delemar]